MKALVLANGELYQPDILRNRIRTGAFDLVLSADGSARHACTLNVTLDAIIGDLDSFADSEYPDTGNTRIISFPAEKNETDLELTLLYARDRGAEQIAIVGAMGGRMDMTIANILLITHAELGSCRIEVWHGAQTGWLIRPPGDEISGHPGDTISLIPLQGNASGITTKGLKYPLKNAELRLGPARGISNLLEQSSAHVELADGLLLAVHTPGRACWKVMTWTS